MNVERMRSGARSQPLELPLALLIRQDLFLGEIYSLPIYHKLYAIGLLVKVHTLLNG